MAVMLVGAKRAGLAPLQKVVVGLGLVALVVVCGAIWAGVGSPAIHWVKVAPSWLWFAVALLAPRVRALPGWLVAAVGVAAVGNTLLCVPLPLGGLGPLLGMGGFALSYLLLVVGFWRGHFHAWGLRYLVTYAALGVSLVVGLWPVLAGAMRLAVPAFAAVIVAMAWSAALTPGRCFFDRRVAHWFAYAGGLLVASDAAVAFAMFSPPPVGYAVALDVFVWVTFLAGWVLILLGIVDPAPVRGASEGCATG